MIREFLITRVETNNNYMRGREPENGIVQIEDVVQPCDIEKSLLKYARKYKLDLENIRVFAGALREDANNPRLRVDSFSITEYYATRDIISGIIDDFGLDRSYIYKAGEILIVTLHSNRKSYTLFVNTKDSNAKCFLKKTNSLACIGGEWLTNGHLIRKLNDRNDKNIGLVIKTSADINELNRYKVLQTI